MMRTLGKVTLACALATTLVGCSDAGGGGGNAKGGDGTRLVAAAEQRADAAIDGVLHDIAAALDLTFGSGGRHFAICGESYAPGGVRMRNFINFEPGALAEADATAAAVRALEEDGWTVERPANPRVVSGLKDELTLRLEVGPAAVQVDLSSACLDTSDDVARETQDRPATDIAWSEPSS